MAYRRYDPRLKNLVATSDDISRFLPLGIPSSTLKQWQKNGVLDFFTLPEFGLCSAQIIQENLALKARLEAILAQQVIIDNFSRYVLAWKTTNTYGGVQTKAVLQVALLHSQGLGLTIKPNVFYRQRRRKSQRERRPTRIR